MERKAMEALVNPPAPLVIAGHEFPNWKTSGATNRIIDIEHVPDDWALTFQGQLGQYVPGLQEDGTTLEFWVYAVRKVAPGDSTVTVIPTRDTSARQS